ncbi:flagellum-specific ATP synthase FliI [Jannaschia sp. W003]|uniref:flagellum-specific ATP synthase FliI n=1 Tax=Jannaschia sp. W003 TaxID=2867012 RepID=UPI0021A6FF48|nr:flagellum-specific ATP synthase FliI [Jannaschia sp. W003]UWQ21838.1 flagellum-specific ATP synthase FliI [Jannaschia sp. W003]
MHPASLEILRARIKPLSAVRPLGRVRRIHEDRIVVGGLDRAARLGDEVVCCGTDGPLRAEVVALGEGGVEAMPYASLDGLGLGAEVVVAGPATIAPADGWLGRIVDPFGAPLDGRPLTEGAPRPIRAAPPPAGRRGGFGARLATGYVALDTLLPVAEGQRMGVFAGSGVGKSRLLGDLARDMEADVVVAALIGERGREVSSFARDAVGAAMARTVVVAATSDRPAGVRRRALPAAIAVAERFRACGARVLFVCDSLTRHAEACRDVAGARGEGVAMPPSLVSELAACLERIGPGADREPAITAVLTVLVAGSDMEEPLADAVRGLLDGHVVLSRAVAEAGRFPAIDPLASVSRSLPEAATNEENATIARTRALLEAYARSELMVTAGLYDAGRDPALDEAIRLRPKVLDALAARAGTPADSFVLLRRALG